MLIADVVTTTPLRFERPMDGRPFPFERAESKHLRLCGQHADARVTIGRIEVHAPMSGADHALNFQLLAIQHVCLRHGTSDGQGGSRAGNAPCRSAEQRQRRYSRLKPTGIVTQRASPV